jgi:hypothetical protein
MVESQDEVVFPDAGDFDLAAEDVLAVPVSISHHVSLFHFYE